jgi:hypothetical protein
MPLMAEIIQIRNVPETVHAELVRQAKAAGLSLNRYVLLELERLARHGRNAEIFRRASSFEGKRPSTKQIVETIRSIRGE